MLNDKSVIFFLSCIFIPLNHFFIFSLILLFNTQNTERHFIDYERDDTVENMELINGKHWAKKKICEKRFNLNIKSKEL